MTDFISKEKRSKVMRAIRSKGNETTELAMIKVFSENKVVGWRRNFKLQGKPDFVFPKDKLIVFVDGCFWHGHVCLKPRDSLKKGFWKDKIERNKRRDKLVNKSLRKDGWNVIRFWECEIEKKKYGKKLNRIQNYLQEAEVVQPTINKFDSLIKQTHSQAKKSGLKTADIKSAVKKARIRK